MLWNIDGHEIDVLFQEQEGIAVRRWDESHKVVCLPARLTKEEAIWSLRNLLNDRESVVVDVEIGKLAMFDRYWPVVNHRTASSPFIRNNTIYCQLKGATLAVAQQEKLRQLFLRQFVMKSIGYWEEYFNQLVPHVVFRKNKTTAFTVSKRKESISFDKDLFRFKQELIDYCVFLAICSYFKIAASVLVAIRQKKYPTYRIFDKTVTYEYDNRNHH